MGVLAAARVGVVPPEGRVGIDRGVAGVGAGEGADGCKGWQAPQTPTASTPQTMTQRRTVPARIGIPSQLSMDKLEVSKAVWFPH